LKPREEAHRSGLGRARSEDPCGRRAANLDLSSYEIVSTEHSDAAAAEAVAMARAGKVEALMKGSLHTDELMRAVVNGDHGLCTSSASAMFSLWICQTIHGPFHY